MFALGFQMTTRDGQWLLAAPAAGTAVIAAIVATCGGVLRARWSALAAACTAGALAIAMLELGSLRFVAGNTALHVRTFAFVGSGVAAAAAAAVIGWKTARSTLGTLRAIAS